MIAFTKIERALLLLGLLLLAAGLYADRRQQSFREQAVDRLMRRMDQLEKICSQR